MQNLTTLISSTHRRQISVKQLSLRPMISSRHAIGVFPRKRRTYGTVVGKLSTWLSMVEVKRFNSQLVAATPRTLLSQSRQVERVK